ncbi:MAG: hypothetical protein B0W54_10280 [Cellvibrio sp. 79]|nr:MAG: hypothetical protein B0W54_10280 [Cellvibrio sp. 79]
MPNSDTAWWVGALFIIFTILSIAAIIIRNNAAKKDAVGRSEKDTIATNVSIDPRKNTRKLD